MFSPESSFCLCCEECGGCTLELLRRHAHGLLHLGGGGRDEVLVDVSAETLLPQHAAHQLDGGAHAGLLLAGSEHKQLVDGQVYWAGRSIQFYFKKRDSLSFLVPNWLRKFHKKLCADHDC